MENQQRSTITVLNAPNVMNIISAFFQALPQAHVVSRKLVQFSIGILLHQCIVTGRQAYFFPVCP